MPLYVALAVAAAAKRGVKMFQVYRSSLLGHKRGILYGYKLFIIPFQAYITRKNTRRESHSAMYAFFSFLGFNTHAACVSSKLHTFIKTLLKPPIKIRCKVRELFQSMSGGRHSEY